MFDMRTESMTNQFTGHSSQVNTVQMDDMKVVSGGDDGFVRVWDLRMSKTLSSHIKHSYPEIVNIIIIIFNQFTYFK
jgi:WD40 repeat protein